MQRQGNQQVEYSLMSNAFFTLGTYLGSAETHIDDHCELSFGHPYAMTSYTYPVIDGVPVIPYGISDNTEDTVFASGDTLEISLRYHGSLRAKTRIYPGHDTLFLEYSLTNEGTESLNAGFGIMYDVALGKWGDAFYGAGPDLLKQPSDLSEEDLNKLVFHERAEAPRGLGLKVGFPQESPANARIGNWFPMYSGEQDNTELYDLALHASWDEQELAPGASRTLTVFFDPLTPDYQDQAFMRWDMPAFLSIENQQQFPARINTRVEVSGAGPGTSLSLKVKEGNYNEESVSDSSFQPVPGSLRLYSGVEVSFPEIYDSLVYPLELQLMQGDQVVDRIVRNVLIPKAPYSNDGLEVSIDTSFVESSLLNLSFHCTVEESGRLIGDLRKTNLFFYKNGTRNHEFSLGKDNGGGVDKADIVFVLDVTGSMGDEIDEVRLNIMEFADSLSFRGVDFRLGMVTFLDEIENIYPFTSDVQQFQANVAAQYAHGGGDRAENSLDALVAAMGLDFRPDANRLFIWITDADYHINNSYTQETKESVVNQLLANGIMVHCIGALTFQTDFYDQIVMNTGGKVFNIYGDFRDILLEVSRLNQSTNYLLTYNEAGMFSTGDKFRIEIHYAGLGGADSLIFSSMGKARADRLHSLTAFPNPFDQDLNIRIEGSTGTETIILELYSLTGTLIKTAGITFPEEETDIPLSRLISPDDLENNRVYLLRTRSYDARGALLDQQTLKIRKN